MKHLSDKEVERFLCGWMAPEEHREIVRHLVAGCRRCSLRLAPFREVLFNADELREQDGGTVTAFYDRALERAAAKARRYEVRHRQEKARLESAIVAARTCSPEELIHRKEIKALRGPTRVEALLWLSFEERYRNPAQMLLLALAAKAAAEILKPFQHGSVLVADLQARAEAELGNAFRVNEQWELAQNALSKAEALLEEGSGDLLLFARVIDVQASLCLERRRLGETLDLLEMVHDLYQQAGDVHLAGRALVKKGIAMHYDGRPQEAVGLLQEGLNLIDSERDPRLISTGKQSLVHALADCGEFRQAGQLLLESGLRQAFADEPLNLLKLRWMEGKVLAGRGSLRRAEQVFEEVREEFFQRGREYDAALVGLELAAVWLRQGRTDEVLEIAEETTEILRDLGVFKEAYKASCFLREVCRQKLATLDLLREVHEFLTRLEWQPHLRFARLR